MSRKHPKGGADREGKWQKRWSKAEQQNTEAVKRRQKPKKGKTYEAQPLTQAPITAPAADTEKSAGASSLSELSSNLPSVAQQTSDDDTAKRWQKPDTTTQPPPAGRKIRKLHENAARTHLALDEAAKRLPTKTVKQKAYDEKRGKAVKFKEKQCLTESEALSAEKPSILRHPANAIRQGIHGQIHKHEKDNVGVEATHKAERVVENRILLSRYQKRTSKPYRKFDMAQERDTRAMSKLEYEKTRTSAKSAKKAQKAQLRKKAMNAKRRSAAKAAKAARAGTTGIKGTSVGSRLTTVLRAKAAKPILILLLIFALLFTFASCATLIAVNFGTAALRLVGGKITTVEGDHYVRDFILDEARGIPYLRRDLAERMYEVEYEVDSHITRVVIGAARLLDPTFEEILEALPTNEELATQIQAVFNGIILFDTETALHTNASAYALLAEMFDMLMDFTAFTIIEWCGQSLETGQGTINMHSQCGVVHALYDCPNPRYGTHLEYTCSHCCHYEYIESCEDCGCDCENCDDECYEGCDCDGCDTYGEYVFSCYGYRQCNSHTILSIELIYNCASDLFYTYFIAPIRELEQSGADPNRLKDLIAHHDLAELMHYIVLMEYGHYITFWRDGHGSDGGDFGSVGAFTQWGYVEMAHNDYVARFIGSLPGGPHRAIQVFDLLDGFSFTVRATNHSFQVGSPLPGRPLYHLDWVPLTSGDHQVLASRGILNMWHPPAGTGARLTGGSVHLFRRRPVIISAGGRNFIGSMHTMIHGSGDWPGWHTPGHACIHFVGSPSRAAGYQPVATHQQTIAVAFRMIQNGEWDWQQ